MIRDDQLTTIAERLAGADMSVVIATRVMRVDYPEPPAGAMTIRGPRHGGRRGAQLETARFVSDYLKDLNGSAAVGAG